MKKINLMEQDPKCLASYYRSGIIQTRDSGMFFLTEEARNKINAFILEIANNPENRFRKKQ